MLTIWSVSAIAFVYLAVLFAIAYFSEKYKVQSFKSLVYGLTLAVYCTSWSFYGTTAQAANNGWWLAPTYVGSLLLFIFGWQVYLKISEICQTHKITSISDFIATRYGQSSSLAGIITAISVFAIIPYISLQLSAISQSTMLIAGGNTDAAQSIFSRRYVLYNTGIGHICPFYLVPTSCAPMPIIWG